VPAFGDQRLDELKKGEAESYALHRDAAPATVAKELRTLQAVVNKAVDRELIPRNPLRGVKPPQDTDDEIRYLTKGELAQLYAASAYRDAWWRLIANTGLRRSEALALRWDAIHGDVLVVASTAGARTKSGKSRGVPLNKAALEALAGMGDAVGRSLKSDAEYVFPRMAGPSLSRAFAMDADRAGLDASMHALRHTFCTQLVLAGVHLRKVQQLAGHSTIRVTERYSRVLVTDLAADVARINL
jgi:integrase